MCLLVCLYVSWLASNSHPITAGIASDSHILKQDKGLCSGERGWEGSVACYGNGRYICTGTWDSFLSLIQLTLYWVPKTHWADPGASGDCIHCDVGSWRMPREMGQAWTMAIRRPEQYKTKVVTAKWQTGIFSQSKTVPGSNPRPTRDLCVEFVSCIHGWVLLQFSGFLPQPKEKLIGWLVMLNCP